MKKMNGKKAALAAALALLLVLVCVINQAADTYFTNNPLPVMADEPAQDPDADEIVTVNKIGSTVDSPVKFSVEPGFYNTTQKLALTAEDAETIFYTVDGSDPTKDGAKRYRQKEITLRAKSDETSIVSVRAVAQYPDGSFSDVVTRSYILGGDISQRFDCLVFSINIDPDYLYNYEDGIFILGKMRDDYLATKPKREIQPTDPANWNQRGMAGERPAYVEVFEYTGNCIISQDCGLRIFGGWSRSNDQKNLRLYARTEYDEVNNRFRYEFFPDALDTAGNKIVSYKKLALRACANDNGSLFARDDAISAAAEAAGIDVKKSRPAAVFLNGEYYGFSWLQGVFSEDWLDHEYNVTDGEWDILKGCEYMMIEDEEDPDWAAMNADWRKMYDYAYTDLTDDKNFEELCELIDIDNFLTYYALNSYIGNGDWPNNNYKVYRYKSGSVEKSDQAPYDGKWRYMLYDTDFAFGLYGNDVMTKHIQYLFDERVFNTYPEDWRDDVHDNGDMYYKRSDLLISLCKRDDMREKWLRILSDISGYYFNRERMGSYLDEYHTKRLHELVAAADEGKAMVWSVAGELENCKKYLERRGASARIQMANVFPDYCTKDGYYTVKCPPVEGATINLSTANIIPDGASFDGWYFNGIEVPLSCTLEEGVQFQRWEINGEAVLDKDTVISDELYGSEIEIKLVVKRTGGIAIYEVGYKGSLGGDYVVLKNYGGETVSTKGLVLCDDKNEFIMPAMNIAAGHTVRVICKNYTNKDALGSIACDFNLKEGETVTLKDDTGEVISQVELRPAHKHTALQRDPYQDRFIEVSYNYVDRVLDAELPTFNWGNWGWGGGGWGGW